MTLPLAFAQRLRRTGDSGQPSCIPTIARALALPDICRTACGSTSKALAAVAMKIPTPPIARRAVMGTMAGGALGYGIARASVTASPNPDQAAHQMSAALNSGDRLTAKLMERPSVRDKGAKGDGVTPDGASIQDALNAFDSLWIPPGDYLIDVPLVIPSFRIVTFASGAIFRPAADGMTVFRTEQASYGSQVIAPRVHADGKSNVTGFDLTNFRHRAQISCADITGCAKGIVLRSLCWDTLLYMPWVRQTKEAIAILDGSNAVDVVHPAIDQCDTAIRIAAGRDYPTTSVRIWGGYVQNGLQGVVDEGSIGAIVDGTYFEGFRDGDIVLSHSIRTNLSRTQHFGNSGRAAIRMAAVDGVTVFDPVMSSGSRTVGLYDIDTASRNVTRFQATTGGGMNAPLGYTGDSMEVVAAASGTFKPLLAVLRGSPRYTRQRGRWRRAGQQLTISCDLGWTDAPSGQLLTVAGLQDVLGPSINPTGAAAPALLVDGQSEAVYGRLTTDGLIRFFAVINGREQPRPLPPQGDLSFSLTCLV